MTIQTAPSYCHLGLLVVVINMMNEDHADLNRQITSTTSTKPKGRVLEGLSATALVLHSLGLFYGLFCHYK